MQNMQHELHDLNVNLKVERLLNVELQEENDNLKNQEGSRLKTKSPLKSPRSRIIELIHVLEPPKVSATTSVIAVNNTSKK